MAPETEYNSEYFLNRYRDRVNLVEEEEEKEKEEDEKVYSSDYFINKYRSQANPVSQEEIDLQEKERLVTEREQLEQRVLEETIELEEELEPKEVVSEIEPVYNSKYFINKYKSNLKVKPTTELASGVEPTTGQKLELGGRLERYTLGNLLRTAQAGLLTISNNKSFKENIKEIETERTEKIFDYMSQKYNVDFRQYQNDAAVITGRVGVAVADPVTFFIPWAKIARAGKITATAAGAGIGATDMALYEYAAYGEINPNNVLFGAAAGGASSLIGAVVANRFPSVADDTINLGKIDSPDADTVVKSTVKDEAVINLEGQDLEALKTVLPIVMKNKATIIDNLEPTLALHKMATQARNDIKEFQTLKTEGQILWDPKKREWNFTAETKINKKDFDILNEKRKQAQKFLKDDLLDYYVKLSEGTGEIVDGTFKETIKQGFEITDSLMQKVLNETFRPLFGGGVGFTAGTFIGDEDDAINYSLMGAGMTFGVVYNRIKDAPYLRQGQKEKAFGLIENESMRMLHNFLKIKGSGTTAARGINHGAENEILVRSLVQVMDGKKLNKVSAEEASDFLTSTFGQQITEVIQNATQIERTAATKIIKQLGTREAVQKEFKLSTEAMTNVDNLIANTNEFKKFFNGSYVDPVITYNKIDNYDLPQIWDTAVIMGNRVGAENAVKKALAAEFPKWNATAAKLTGETSLDNAAERIVADVLGEVTESVFKRPKTKAEVFGNFEAIPQLKNYQRERIFKSLEARKELEPFLKQDLKDILEDWVSNTVKGVEFARQMGQNGEIVNKLAYGLRQKFRDGVISEKELDSKLRLMKNTVQAYFGLVGKSATDPLQSNLAKDGFALLTFLSNTTMLPRSIIPQLGDFLQPFQNSKVGSAAAGFADAWKKDGIAARYGIGGSKANTIGSTVNKDIEGVFSAGLHPSTTFQQKLSDWTKTFFKINGMAPATNFAAKVAFSTGINEVFDIAKKIGNRTKISRSLQTQLNFYGITKQDLEGLRKFKTLEEALDSASGQAALTKVGMKAFKRDVGLPGIGNRMIFAQSNNPMIKSAGLFLSWAQYKVGQMNGLINRVENGDLKLAIKMLGTIGIFGGLRELQIMMSPSREYYAEKEPENFSAKWWGQAAGLSGIIDWRAEKLSRVFGSWAGSQQGTATSAISPLFGLLDKWYNNIGKTYRNLDAGDYEGAAVSTIKTVPLGSEVIDYTNRINESITGQPLLQDVENRQPSTRPTLTQFSKGGLVGEETIEGPQVPFTQDNAADRINPLTGLPYNQPLIKYQ